MQLCSMLGSKSACTCMVNWCLFWLSFDQDAGYRSKSLFSVEEDDEEYTQKIDDEVL